MFEFQRYGCNRYHDLLTMSINLNNIAILNNKNADYCCIISGISEGKAVKLLKHIDLTEVEHYKSLYQKEFFKL